MSRTVKISFYTSGNVTQTIEVEDDCTLSDAEIVEGLERGEVLTTMREGGTVFVLGDDFPIIGVVDDVENALEYTNFELE